MPPSVQMALSQRGSEKQISPTNPKIVFRVLFLAGAKDAAVSAAEADGRLPGGSDRRHQALVHDAGEHHQGNIARLGVGNAQSVDEVAFLCRGVSECASARCRRRAPRRPGGHLAASCTTACAHFCRVALSSSAAPPILTTIFTAGPPLRPSRTSGSCSAPLVRPRL